MHTVWGSEPEQETVRGAKSATQTYSISKSKDSKTKPIVERKSHKTTEYFLSRLSYESDKKKSAEATQQEHKNFADVLNGI